MLLLILLRICFPEFRKEKDPLAKPCTTIAEDCIPTFPPVPPINGMNKAIAGLETNPASKFPKITEFANPPNIPISNQGRRADV